MRNSVACRAFWGGCLLLCFAAALGEVSIAWAGRAAQPESSLRVIDGDSITFRSRAADLAGIDAPELGQRCMNAGKQWRCGLEAALALQKLISFGPINCKRVGRERVRQRVVCTAQDNDLAETMLAQGYAIALPDAAPGYIGAQSDARDAGLGVWRGDFVRPWAWRGGTRLPSEPPARGRCSVKGMINNNNLKLYLVPSDDRYGDIRINRSRGERMFCSDDEAVLAGWTKYPTD